MPRSFKQHDLTDCGAACLAFVCEFHRLRLSLALLRRELGTDQRGTTAASLIATAGRLGFTAKGVKGPREALPSVPLPAIAHCRLPGELLHYVVLVEWKPRFARVMDPAVGRVEKWSHEKFAAVWTGVLILLAPGTTFQAGDRTVTPLRRLWGLLRPHGPVLAEAFAGAVASTILGLGVSIYVQKIIDYVIPDGNRALLNLLSLGMLLLLALRLALGWCQGLLSFRMAQRIDANLILGYYRHLFSLPQGFFNAMRVGEITSRVADVVKIRNFLNSALLSLILNPLILVFSLGAMFLWSWKLALLSVALIPLHLAVYGIVDHRNRRGQRELMERSADFDAHLVESLQSQSTIRSFGLEAQAAIKTEITLVRLLRTSWKTAVTGLGGSMAAMLITQAFTIGLLWIGAGMVLDAGLSPGQLMSCYSLAGYLTGPVSALIGLNASIQEAMIATDRLFELMDLEREADPGAIEFLPRHAGVIEFEKVTHQPAGRAPAVQGLSLRIEPGKLTVLSGASGSGKSTVLALMQRLYVPTEGRILVGGCDVRHFQLASWRRHLAVVSQHTHLFTGTVLENLAPGEERPDVERLLTLARQIGARDFIEALPRGLLTPLTENGSNLSGGQRQRLAILRALYRDAPIVLMDEPSSALDVDAESLLIAHLRELCRQGRTVVVASHAHAFLQAADATIQFTVSA